MENQKFEFNKPQLPVEEVEEKPQELPGGGFDASRRNFLKLAVVGAASLLVNPDEAFARQENKEVAKIAHYEKNGHQRRIYGEWARLEPLHQAVSNGFEERLGEEIKKPENRLSISNFKGHIGRKNGKYSLEYTVDLIPVDKEEKADRIVGVRGKVWSGNGAIEGVHKLYVEEVVPWQHRMKEEYPDASFSHEVTKNGNDTLYQKTCIMKGAIKK